MRVKNVIVISAKKTESVIGVELRVTAAEKAQYTY